MLRMNQQLLKMDKLTDWQSCQHIDLEKLPFETYPPGSGLIQNIYNIFPGLPYIP